MRKYPKKAFLQCLSFHVKKTLAQSKQYQENGIWVCSALPPSEESLSNRIHIMLLSYNYIHVHDLYHSISLHCQVMNKGTFTGQQAKFRIEVR